ncbi:MAG TPA: nicotinamidase [bacterium]|nr:nicotinamidase [bacterium]
MKALLVVDVQNDFCPGGALAVPEGDKVVPVINSLMPAFPLVIASKDWHPKGSVHFKKWPPHCVQDTPGADFHPKLDVSKLKKVFLKGTKNKDDGYSAFEATNTNLAEFLKKEGVEDLYVVGLATDYCVKATALDADKYGFETFVVEDAVAAVNAKPGDGDKALKAMAHAGITLLTADEVLEK